MDSSAIQASPNVSATDCSGASFPAGDVYNGFAGVWLNCSPNQNHTLALAVDGGHACINFALEATGLVAWLIGPSRTFNSGADARVFVFAGLRGGCGNPPFGTGAIRACQTAYGWLLQINSTSSMDDGTYDTVVAFYN